MAPAGSARAADPSDIPPHGRRRPPAISRSNLFVSITPVTASHPDAPGKREEN